MLRGKFAAPQNCPDARLEFKNRERLGKVIVGTEFETEHAVQLGRFCRQHQDRNRDRLAAQVAAELQAVHAGQHQVEHDELINPVAGALEAIHAIVDDIDLVGIVAQMDFQ